MSAFLAGLALKNPPKKNHQKTRFKKLKKKHLPVGFFERSLLCFVKKFAVFPFKRP
jgi:hypothetical protein